MWHEHYRTFLSKRNQTFYRTFNWTFLKHSLNIWKLLRTFAELVWPSRATTWAECTGRCNGKCFVQIKKKSSYLAMSSTAGGYWRWGCTCVCVRWSGDSNPGSFVCVFNALRWDGWECFVGGVTKTKLGEMLIRQCWKNVDKCSKM